MISPTAIAPPTTAKATLTGQSQTGVSRRLPCCIAGRLHRAGVGGRRVPRLRGVATRVVILGAGFAGCSVARLLGRDRDLAVTLVDPHNFMLYTPLLPEAASGTVEPRHAVVPVRVMCPRARLVLGVATGADFEARKVSVTVAGGTRLELGYDHLVVALGAVTRTASVPGLLEHGLGFKTIGQAIALRNRVLGQLERAAVEPDPAERARLLTFVFVGGGYAGVEALAELEDLVRDASGR